MNRIYRLVFNRSLGQVQVASEVATAPCCGGIDAAPQRHAPLRLLALMVALAIAAPAMAQTLPSLNTVVRGADAPTSNGAAMTINQTANSALINWNTFNIGQGGSVTFVQPSANAVALNVAVGGNGISTIDGALNANGRVFLINTQGIAFGSNARVDVGGLVASTLPLQGDDAGLPMLTFGNPQSPSGAQLSNAGVLGASGSVMLLGSQVVNTGTITAAQGITLAAAGAATLTEEWSGPRLTLNAASPSQGGAAIDNTGTLAASGIGLQAASQRGVFTRAINAGGSISGSGSGLTLVSQHMGSQGGAATPIELGGTLSASNITVFGPGSVILSAGSALDAGSISVTASSISQANGGTANGTDGIATGNLMLDVGGSASLLDTDNRITGIGGSMGSLALNNAASLGNSGTLNVGGTTNIVNASADGQTRYAINLTNPTNSFAGQLTLTGADTSISAGSALSFGNIDVADLTIISAGTVTLGGTTTSADAMQVTATGLSQSASNTVAADSLRMTLGTGSATLANVGNTIGAIGGTMGSLDLTNATAIGNAGTLQVTGTSRIRNVGGTAEAPLRYAINLGNTENSFGGQVDLTGAATTISGVDRLLLGNVDVTSLDANAGVEILQASGAAISVSGTSTFDASADITLANTGNSFGGIVDLSGGEVTIVGSGALQLGTVDANSVTASADTQLSSNALNVIGNATLTGNAVRFGATNVSGVLEATARAGSINQLDSVKVTGQTRLQATGGDIVLNRSDNRFDGAVAIGGDGAVYLQSGSDLRVSALESGANTVEVGSGGRLRIDGAIDAGNASVSLRGNGGLLDLRGDVRGGDVVLHGHDGFNLGNDVVATGMLGLSSSNASILQTQGMLDVAGVTTIDSGSGTVTLENRDNHFGTGVTLRSGSASLATSGDLLLRQVNASALRVDAGAITQNSALHVGGATQLLATGAINLGNAGNSFGGQVTLDAGADATIRSADVLHLGSVEAASLTAIANSITTAGDITTTGAQRYDGTLQLNGSRTFTSRDGAVISFNGDVASSANGAHALHVATAGLTTFGGDVGSAQARLGGVTIDGAARVGGDIHAIGAIDIAGALTLTDDVAMRGMVIDLGAVDGDGVDARNLSLTAVGRVGLGTVGGSVALDGLSVAAAMLDAGAINTGMLDIATDAAITQNAAWTSTGAASFASNHAITLDNVGNSFGGPVALQGTSATLYTTGPLQFGNVRSAGLVATAGGAITQAAGTALDVTGATNITAIGHDINLDDAGNTFGGTLALTGADVVVDTDSGVAFGDVDAGSLIVTSGGGIGQASGSALQIAGNAGFTATGDIALVNAGNRFDAPLSLAGAAVTVNAVGTLEIASLGSTGNVALSADALLLRGALDVGGNALSLRSGIGALQLGQRLRGGAVDLYGASGIELGADVDATTLTLDGAAGAIVQSAGTLQVSGATTASAARGIALDGSIANVFGAEVTLTSAEGDLGIVGSTPLHLGRIEAGGALRATSSSIILGGNVTTAGDQRYAGTVTVQNTVDLLSSGGGIGFDAGIVGAGGVRATAFDGVAIGGDVALSGDLRISADTIEARAIDVGGALALTTRGGALQQNGAYRVGGDASFDAGGYDIGLGNTGNTFGGAVALTGADVSIHGSSLTLADVVAGGDLQATSASQIDQRAGTSVQVDGQTSLAGSGAITLTNADNRFDGRVSLAGSAIDVAADGVLDVATASGSSIALRGADGVTLAGPVSGISLVLGSDGGAISAAGLLDIAGSTVVNAGDGAITLDNAGNRFGGTVDLQGGAVRINAASNLRLGTTRADSLEAWSAQQLGGGQLSTRGAATLSGAALVLDQTNVGGVLHARSRDGALTQTAAVTSGGSDLYAGGDIVLDDAGNRFGGSTAIAAGGTVDLYSTGYLQLATLTSGTDAAVAVRAGGALASAVEVDTGTATLTLQAEGGQLTSRGTLRGGDITLSGRDGIAIDGGVVAGGALALRTTDAAIRQSGAALSVAGTSSIDAGSADITLDHAANRFGGAVDVRGGAVRVAAAENLQLGRALASTLTATAGGALQLDQVQAGTLTATAGGALSTGTLQIDADAALHGTSLQLGATSVGGDLQASSGAGGIGQVAALNVAGTTALEAGGDIVLDNAGNRFDGAVTLSGAQARIASDGALTLDGVDVAGLRADAGAALSVRDAAIAGDATLSGVGVAVAAVAVDGALAIASDAGISQQGVLRVGGASDLSARGAVTLDNAGNDFGGAVTVSGAGVSLVDANDLQIASVLSTPGSGLRVAASGGGAVSLVAGGTLTLPEATIDTGDEALHLASNGGSLATRGALSGGEVSLHGRDGLTLAHDVAAGTSLGLSSAAAITQSGGALRAPLLGAQAGGAIALTGSNAIAALGNVQAANLQLVTSGDLDVRGDVDAGDALLLDVRGGDLAIAGTLAAGTVRLQADGAIGQGASSRIVADTLSGRAGAGATLGSAAQFVANQVATLGDFAAPGGFSMTNARTLTLASVNGSAFSVDAGSAALFLKVDGGDLLQRGTTPAYAGTGHWWSSGRMGTAVDPIYVVSGSPQQVVDFVGLPPAYFYAVQRDGTPVNIGGAINVPTSVVAARAQSGSLQRVAYVDMGALNAEYRAFGIVQPGLRLPVDQQPSCDVGDPDAACTQ